MLSRTADHLYWMARYSERAENLARLLDVNYQMSLVPHDAETERSSWNAIIALNSLEYAYAKRHDEVTATKVLHFMLRDETHPSSIYSCLRAARENAHAVRGTLTAEMWETINETWLQLRDQSFAEIHAGGIAAFFDWVKQRASLLRGAMFGTMLRDEAFQFIRLGALLERADNTARILDVKYHSLAGAQQSQGDDLVDANDFYHWGALLRSVSAFEVYRKVYRDVITPERVAELLILREDLPRALHSCMGGIVRVLEKVRNSRSDETVRRAGQLYATLRYGRMDDIFERGLHAWLDAFIDSIGDLSVRISEDFLVGA
ncbi:MAG: hypothetical protein AzoDbin1_01073 [Azoarcus sp.]|uniref:Uncharacterized conserved protein, Alpha-E superfamily n=1 Tax=Aromatoleum tolulyticum TaxID=34027 RepID=A0A1N6X3Z6_9RHOO|nr:alpha-E domain-containing protein [Aromatoleum tolulyticum]MCK9984601.1 hypothetical protein [Azoarcus sp.]SIQ96980.1 Uncharacterized conserved protein, Alpha-E superfamily [Aromatoleum tolulyticum]